MKYIDLHLLQDRCRHCHLQRQVLLPPLCIAFMLHPYQKASDPMVESSQGPINSGGHCSCLWSKKFGLLHDFLVKRATGPVVLPLLYQSSGHPSPLPPGLPWIGNYHHPVVVWRGQYPPEVFEHQHHLQWSSLGLEGCCPALVVLLFNLLTALPFHYIGAHLRGWVLAVQCLPGDELVSSGESFTGEIPLLQYHCQVLHLVVHKVDPLA